MIVKQLNVYMEQLCGKSRQEMISDLGDKIFPVPDLAHPDRVSYQPADEYLSGNIRQKLDEARVAASQNPMFERNIPALEKVLPPKLRAGDIKVRLGATWIKPEYIRQFMYETMETPRYYQAKDRGYGGYRGNTINVEYVPEAGLWHVSNPTSDTSIKATRDFGTKDLTAYEILDNVLNLRAPKVYMTVPDPGSERGEKRVLDGEATSLAQKKAAALQQAFENWVFKDPERAADLVETYNDKFNSMRPREYDGSHLIFPGMAADIKLREHQRNAIAHALYGGNALFAHCVGAGKTYEMIATAMEGKRLGMHHKSLFVVPKHLTSQIGEDFLRLYPSANILVATTKDFKASNRRELMARIATGNYDAVIISRDQFKALPLSAERATRQMQQEVDTLLIPQLNLESSFRRTQ
ncbi:MAG: DEAD/DEAH box helicase family protein [Oscillospiraceae bacterium]|nr:DEAD/DEAH box helicase family protein [Oscillospiraceae bacterium]